MTPLVTFIIPTIAGREDLFDQTLERIAKVADSDLPNAKAQVVVPENYPTIGEAWNAGMEDAEGTYVWLGADDALLAPGSIRAAIHFADERKWPSPRITNPNGSLHSCGTLGQGTHLDECATRTRCYSSPFPFFARTYWNMIGPCIPVHYYADDYLAWRASAFGMSAVVVREYEIQHLEGMVGRADVAARAFQDKDRMLEAIYAEHPCD